ncbi:uracil-DNA glycosylase [Parvibaculum sp.]|uniref:uracil-DNA glycosylase n=1 Tax=Parvibaculum sp. TaxID=2024848 RepID=UPI000C94BF30|nr:uracil-DNA glycosylase [Parvibaculum sp.]MAB15452.1 uracil-DNA glycosylase [Parvibaculum sp.]
MPAKRPAKGNAVASRPEPPADCDACPRLAAFRHDNAAAHPDWFNKPVPSFGPEDARFLIVGLAPGLQGANKTGRPFTGDYAGDLLYATLDKYGFSEGSYGARPDDGLQLRDAMITNAVRCVPPQNKPTGEETRNCLSFLSARIAAMPNLTCLLALGRIAHDAVLTVRELRKSQYKFAHGASHDIGGGLTLFDSYHCSRYNTNTGRLTEAMFHDVFDLVAAHLGR